MKATNCRVLVRSFVMVRNQSPAQVVKQQISGATFALPRETTEKRGGGGGGAARGVPPRWPSRVRA